MRIKCERGPILLFQAISADMWTAVEKFHHFPLVHPGGSSLFLLNIHVTFFYVFMSLRMHVCAPCACPPSVDPMELKLQGVVDFHGVLKSKSQVLFKKRWCCLPMKHLQLLLHGSLRDVYSLNQRAESKAGVTIPVSVWGQCG